MLNSPFYPGFLSLRYNTSAYGSIRFVCHSRTTPPLSRTATGFVSGAERDPASACHVPSFTIKSVDSRRAIIASLLSRSRRVTRRPLSFWRRFPRQSGSTTGPTVTDFRKPLADETTRRAGSSVVAKTPSPSVSEAIALANPHRYRYCYRVDIIFALFFMRFFALSACTAPLILTVGSATRVTYVRAIRLPTVRCGRFSISYKRPRRTRRRLPW